MAINFRELFALRAKRLMVPAATIAALVAAGAPPAWATDYFVTNATDSGAGSLRQAILDLNGAGAGTHSIIFSSGLNPITLTGDLPPILGTGQTVSINGEGNTIDGDSNHALLFVGGGTVAISDLTLLNGHANGGNGGNAPFGGGGGGGLGAGGALFVNDGATVTITGVEFDGNEATGGNGGAYYNDGGLFLEGGGGGGGLRGDGGLGGNEGGGGGGGLGAAGGDGGGVSGGAGLGGGGGGGATISGSDGGNTLGGSGGGEGGAGGDAGSDGAAGTTYGGGGGAGQNESGGAGGDFGGGGGAAHDSSGSGGAGGFGGGGGGAGYLGGSTSGVGGFGAGNGGGEFDGGDGGDAYGGAIFVRGGGSLTIVDSGISGSQVAAGQGGNGNGPTGSNGSAAGAGLYLHTGTWTSVEVTTGQTSTWEDGIAGDGSINKTGEGTLTLNGANTYTGAMQVLEGTLVVNGSLTNTYLLNVQSGAALGGSGSLADLLALSGSTIRPGNSIGTLTTNFVAFHPGSTLEIEINNTGTTAGVNNDNITTNSVTIGGGTVAVTSTDTSFAPSSNFTFLQSNNNIVGQFDAITDDLAFFDAVLGYTSNSAFFTLIANQSNFASHATTFNQSSLGSYIDHGSLGAPHGLQQLIDEMTPMSTSQLVMSLDQLTGSIYGSSMTASQQHATFYLSQLAQRLRGRMTPGDPLSSSGYADASEQQGADFMLVSYQPVMSSSNAYSSNVTSHRAWVTGYGMGGSADGDGNADGFDYGLGGTQFAIEEAIAENWAAGFWGNTAWGQLSGDTLAQSAELESYHFGGYLVGFDGCDYWIALGGGGYNHTQSSRNIAIGNVGGLAQANIDGGQATAYLERGRSFCYSGWTTQPYAALQYVYIGQEGFTENGAGPANLTVGAMDSHSMRSIVGGRISTDIARTSCRTLTPELRAAWVHEFLDTNQAFTASLPGVGGGFAVQGVDLGRDWALLGTGLNLQMGASTRLFGGYDLQVNDHQAMHIGSGGVEYVW